jgi:glycosyltransferase involved in cell wall biosynthesis
MNNSMSLTAIVPFYNEGKTLKDSIDRLVSTDI